MSQDSIDRLINGYRGFRKQYLAQENDAYRGIASKGQQPKVMFVSCSDSRINPAIITQAGLGEVFAVHNVANLVPPFKVGVDTHHGTSAALEFAVLHLKVTHIVILGHSGCGGIEALMKGDTSTRSDNLSFIGSWISIAQDAKKRTLEKVPDGTLKQQCQQCEREALLVSLANLRTFPWIEQAVQAGDLKLHAWHFDIETGEIQQYAEQAKQFKPL